LYLLYKITFSNIKINLITMICIEHFVEVSKNLARNTIDQKTISE